MIIWGSTGKEKTIGRGHFHCPQCNAMSSYLQRRVSRYFTLYFIPLFPLESLGEYVQCEGCTGQFAPAILSLSAEQIQAMLEPWHCAACGNTNAPGHEECLGCKAPREGMHPPMAT